MKILILIMCVLTSSVGRAEIDSRVVDQVIAGAINRVLELQSKVDGVYHQGEWPIQISTNGVASSIGLGKPGAEYEDPSSFVTALTHNLLAEIYLGDNSYNQIPDALRMARDSFKYYESKEGYNFWPLYKSSLGFKARRPKYLPTAFFLKGFENIPADSDTHSGVALAKKLGTLVDTNLSQSSYNFDFELSKIFAYTDTNRPSSHPYNAQLSYKNTGAFLTWLHRESGFVDPIAVILPSFFGTRIPFGINDVDCVVNGNILRAISYSENKQNYPLESSCNYLKKVVANQDFGKCGLYYSSRYYLHYLLSEAQSLGISCLDEVMPKLQKDILQNYDPAQNGWFSSKKDLDIVHSNLFSVRALMLTGSAHDQILKPVVDASIIRILKFAKQDSKGNYYWEKGNFFNANPYLRYDAVWKSESYTTALAVNTLVAYKFWLSNKNLSQVSVNTF